MSTTHAFLISPPHPLDNHWLLNSGEPIGVPRGDEADLLIECAQRVQQYDPNMAFWHSRVELWQVFGTLLKFSILENTGKSVDRPPTAEDDYIKDYFSIDGDKLVHFLGLAIQDQLSRNITENQHLLSTFQWSPLKFSRVLEDERNRKMSAKMGGSNAPGHFGRLFYLCAVQVRLRFARHTPGNWGETTALCKTREWLVAGGQERADLVDELAARLSNSAIVAQLVADGRVDSVLGGVDLYPFQPDKQSLVEYFKMDPKHYAEWRRLQWPLIQQALLREAARMLKENEEATGSFIIHPVCLTRDLAKGQWASSLPVEAEPLEGLNALRAIRSFRKAKEDIGSAVQFINDLEDREEPPLSAIQSSQDFANETQGTLNDFGEEILNALDSVLVLYDQWQKPDPVIGETEGMLVKSRKIVFTAGDEEDEEAGGKSKAQGSGGIDEDDGFECDELEDDSDEEEESDGETDILDEGGHLPEPSQREARDAWTNMVKDDIHTLSTAQTERFFRMILSIITYLEKSETNELSNGRTRGANVKWADPRSSKKFIQQKLQEGHSLLRDVDSFGEASYLDTLWSIGSLVTVYPGVLTQTLRATTYRTIAVLLTCSFLSPRPWLYAPTIDLVFDHISALTDSSLIASNVTRLERQKTLAMLSTMKDFANGCQVSAAVASRSMMSAIRGQQKKTWIRNLIASSASIARCSLKLGPFLKCARCKPGDIIYVEQITGGFFQGQSVAERLSVITYTPRRGRYVEYLHSVGRTMTFTCLIRLLERVFHRTFIITFLYFSSVMHFRHRAERGKPTYASTAEGPARIG